MYSQKKDQSIEKNNESSDWVIILVIIWLFVTDFYYNKLEIYFPSYWEEEWYGQVDIVVQLIWGILPLVLSYTMKDKNNQQIVFVFGLLYLVYTTYRLYCENILYS